MNCSDFNQMLDLYIDGELNDEQRSALEAHAAQCDECRSKLEASEQLREILSHMDDDVSVPLPAQAAWRNAVRAEAKKARMKKIYSFCGAVAAVCVLTVGMTAMLGQNASAPVAISSARVETDGVSQDAGGKENMALTAARTRSIEYIDCTVAVENPVEAYDYLCDAIAEYGGTVEQEIDGDSRKVFVQIAGENCKDFISTVESIGSVESEMNPDTISVDESAASVGVCVTIVGA